MKIFLLMLLAIQVAGCGVVARQKGDELLKRSQPADWGVLDPNHQTKELLVILKELKDPDSAKFRFKLTRNAYYLDNNPVLAWYSSVFVNAKNSFGGYTGEQKYIFVYQCPINQGCELIGFARPNSRYPHKLDWAK